MAPTEGRVDRPERRWGCRRGTPRSLSNVLLHRFVVLYTSLCRCPHHSCLCRSIFTQT